MKRIYLFVFVMLLGVSFQSYAFNRGDVLFYGGIGIDYTDVFFAILNKIEISPFFISGFQYSFHYRRITIGNSLDFSYYTNNQYYKNNLLYYTDKTRTSDFCLRYQLSFKGERGTYINSYWGGGFEIVNRYEVYSIGKLLSFTENRILPHPFIFAGFSFTPYKTIEFLVYSSAGAGIGYKGFYRDERFVRAGNDISIASVLNVESAVSITKNVSFFINWRNRLLVTLDLRDIVGTIFWSNSIYTGVLFEIK